MEISTKTMVQIALVLLAGIVLLAFASTYAKDNSKQAEVKTNDMWEKVGE